MLNFYLFIFISPYSNSQSYLIFIVSIRCNLADTAAKWHSL